MLFRLLILASLLAATPAAFTQSLTERLGNALGMGPAADEILNPDVAFLYEAAVTTPQAIRLEWLIEDGYYLYHDKFKFAISAGPAEIDQAGVKIPAGKIKEDLAFGKVEINTGSFAIDLPLRRQDRAESPVTLELRYQGCKDESVCYPPMVKQLDLLLPAFIPAANVATGQASAPAATPAMLSEQDAITRQLEDGSLLLNILVFFGFGLLLSLTPCVFPMIPILSGIIVGQGKTITTAKAFSLSLAYVLAMALTYAILGVIAGSFYFNLQAAFQNPWVLSLFSLVFVALALSMFGFYELQLPAALQSRLAVASDGQPRGTLRGAAFMGALSAIIVGPCVAPPLAGALLYISQSGDALLGGLALFAMGLGFGVPLLLIGSSAGSLLPRAGAWMDVIKRIFGVLMLGVAAWFMERVLPGGLSLLLWAALFITCAVYLGALEPLPPGARWQALWKGLGVLLLVYGIVLVLGAASGGRNLYHPLQGLAGGAVSSAGTAGQAVPFKRIKGLDDLDREMAAAAGERLVMLDFYADWCVTCKEMEEYTFSDGRVRNLLNEMVLLQADVTANDAEDRALLKAFSIYGPPAILFFDREGTELPPYRLVGFVDAEAFTRHLQTLMDRAP